tara:strand:- start:4315 stop:5301 length:987 start_codon:yes stop_codon:yes gene_type:complete
MNNIHNTVENYYSLLGIEKNASHEEIKKAYRKLSLECHPDRNRGDTVKTELYKKMTEAYTVLSDKSERKKYDFSLNNNFNAVDIDPSFFMKMFFNSNESKNIFNELSNLPLEDIITGIGINSIPLNNIHIDNKFNSNFLNKRFAQNKDSNYSKPETIFKTINITLLESYTGSKLPISITRWIIEYDKKIQQTETIYIEIPKGIDNNEIITIINKGNRKSDDNRGDIEIKISIKEHDVFERNGIDLLFKKSITLKESFCGFSFDLIYIDGKEFKINNKPGNIIKQDFRKVIPKLGIQRDNSIGDLIIIFDIIYPKEFTLEQINELKKIL